MLPRQMTLRGIGIGLAFVVLSGVPTLSAGSRDDKPLPGSDLTLRQAVEQADAITVGRRFRPMMGGGSAFSVYMGDVEIESSLKGGLARGRLRSIGVTIRPNEALPPDERGNDSKYLFFVTRREVKRRRPHGVIKMLHATPENVRSVRELLDKKPSEPRPSPQSPDAQ